MQPNGKIANGNYAAHILECAEIAKQVGEALGLRDDAARQACFATVCIDAKGHGVFLEPVPKDSKTPVLIPEAAVASNATVKDAENQKRDEAAAAHDMGGNSGPGEDAAIMDEAAAAKADAQVADVPKTATPEMDEGARRTSFLSGIESARQLLNNLGHKPEVTPKGLCAYIKEQFPPHDNLGTLEIDQLEKLVMLMSGKVDELREANRKAAELLEAPF